jgi:hypothetical protein
MKNLLPGAMKRAIPKHVKPRVENHAKGGYHVALSNARIS